MKKVQFDEVVVVHELPIEDRKSNWITIAVDRERFNRKIKILERSIGNIYLEKLKIYKSTI